MLREKYPEQIPPGIHMPYLSIKRLQKAAKTCFDLARQRRRNKSACSMHSHKICRAKKTVLTTFVRKP